MAEFLLELLSEEIPARMQIKAAEDLKTIVAKGLADNGLSFTTIESYSTPRRIALVVSGLPLQQPDQQVEKKGPRTDAPAQAIQGFLKSIGRADFDASCVKEETQKGTFWFYRDKVNGRPTSNVLAIIVENMFDAFVWPKSMRWKTGEKHWVRPLHSIIALFDGTVVPLAFKTGGGEKPIEAAETTKGHRFLSPAPFTVGNFSDYKTKLQNAHVLLERSARKDIISSKAQSLAGGAGLAVKADDALLEEIAGLVEWPVPLIGSFEKEFLGVPQEVLISTMRGNQKYIALLDKAGKLADKFIVVANTEAADGGKAIVAGNEKVLRARLSDAKFYWDQDRRHTLESRLPALDKITFHQKLGTVRQRADRLKHLAHEIAGLIGADEKSASRAAELCKADLISGVVFQFPEVQGTIGGYYALHDKEKQDVATAIAEHYKPQGANDTCPTAPVSIAVALADKIDALTGFFAIDEKPTGSKDPFALRRAALGVIRIILENNLKLPLTPLFRASWSLYNNASIQGLADKSKVEADLLSFFQDRLKVMLKDREINSDIIEGVYAARFFDDVQNVRTDDVLLVSQLANAIKRFLSTGDGKNLLAGYKRAANILRIEEKKDAKSYAAPMDDTQFSGENERQLWGALIAMAKNAHKALKNEDFEQAMREMSSVREPIDHFFENVLVNDANAEVRAVRLGLLAGIRDKINIIADFSKIEG